MADEAAPVEALLEDAPAADAAKTDASAPAKTDSTPAAQLAGDEAKPEPKPEGEASKDAKPEAKGEASLLAEDDDGKAPKDKADGQADAKPKEAPEKYEAFKLPEGMTIDEGTLAKATPLFKELGLDQDKAQKLVSLYAEQIKAGAEAAQAATLSQHQTLISEWTATVKADPEFAGDKLTQAKAVAINAINTLARTPQEAIEIKNILKETGFGNHPALFGFLVRAGTKLSPDTLVHADAAAQSTPKRPEERLWPNMTSKEQ